MLATPPDQAIVATVVPLRPGTLPGADPTDAFLGRYANAHTKANYRGILIGAAAHAGVPNPTHLTEAAIVAYCTHGDPSNNTVYCRRSALRRFLAWCETHEVPTACPGHALSDTDSPLRTYKKTYGKVQSKNAGRWLTHDDAYGRLLDACRDGTATALRDEVALRLGLLGMRADEIRRLALANVAQLPEIHWTGKGRKPRTAHAGPALCQAITAYLDQYSTPTPDSPLLCPSRCINAHTRATRLAYGQPLAQRTLNHIVARRAQLAGLGHLAPHDLRRSAAGILHRSTDATGAHHFDLLDIQQLLGHADPATTMRSYLEPLNREVLQRAATVLD